MDLTPVGDRAIALFKRGQIAEALELLDGALRDNPASLAPLALKGHLLHAARRFEEALACFDRSLAAEPALAETWNQRGALLSDMTRYADALESYGRALAARPDYIEALYNRGNALRALKREDDAVASFDSAIVLKPDFLPAWHNRGSALHALKRYGDAVESFDKALAINSGVAESWNNRGIALAALKRHDEALASYDQSLALDPGLAHAWDNRGTLLREMGRANEALASHDRALAINPRLADAWFNRGNILRELRYLDEALKSYDRSLDLMPANAHAWTNRGIVLRDLKRIPEALASYSKALAINPDYVETLYSRGIASWVENHDYQAALSDLERAVRLDPDCPYALGGLLLVRQYGGDWRNFDSDVAWIDAGVRAGKAVAEPFLYQAVSQSPADLQACSVIHAQDRYPAQIPLVPAGPRRPGKIRIGYVSGEFREQATAFLMAGLYECHDKSKFEITAFDNGWNDKGATRARLEAAFDQFIDISRLSDRDAAGKIVGEEIDILVNLNGYFGDHRMGVFAYRPARLQVNYLGFPATLGAPYMDYIIADRIVIPEAERQFYTEQVAYLPDSYQVNDSRRAVAEALPPRAACGLPEKAFVFCNFNAGYKLTPSAFASWMRIMRRSPDSLLWLLEGDPQFAANLRRQAEADGVAGTRIVFAPVMPLAAHLARLQLADLFLDGIPYNAHTTASDALWAGVPLITCRGRAFPGRVAASLLSAIGLDELVTENREDYESLAIKLAADAKLLKSIRDKLGRNRRTTPLFDTQRFARHIEAAYETMLARRERGQAPESFAVAR
ncbi:MAG TPA: tetratricopeptide repeat protein [Rhizomicrobium sp.]|nr:tetratricopeptide repeat protein [Rhizomicrobium sp.]